MNIKYNLLANIFSFFRTLRSRKWLDNKGYLYTFNFFDFFKNDKNRVNIIKKILNKYKFGDKKYVVYLTKFDTYGNYKLPNKIFLNIYQPLDKIHEVLKHEIKHLEVEDMVIRENLNHEEKEKLVDSIK